MYSKISTHFLDSWMYAGNFWILVLHILMVQKNYLKTSKISSLNFSASFLHSNIQHEFIQIIQSLHHLRALLIVNRSFPQSKESKIWPSIACNSDEKKLANGSNNKLLIHFSFTSTLILPDESITTRSTASKAIDSQWFHPNGFASGTLSTKNGNENNKQVQGLILSIVCIFAFLQRHKSNANSIDLFLIFFFLSVCSETFDNELKFVETLHKSQSSWIGPSIIFLFLLIALVVAFWQRKLVSKLFTTFSKPRGSLV